MTADKRRGSTIRIERMGPAQLKVIREQLFFVHEVADAGQAYATRINAAGKRLRSVIRAATVGDLWASADREAYKAALERGRTLDISFLDIIAPPSCDQKRFEEITAEIERRLEAQEIEAQPSTTKGVEEL